VPDPGLGCQVDHGFKFSIGEEAFGAGPVGQIQRKEPESRPNAKLAQARVFQPGIIVVVKVVDAHDFMPFRQEALNQVRTNETGSARDQDSIFSSVLHA
jgi:hypothetical protein